MAVMKKKPCLLCPCLLFFFFFSLLPFSSSQSFSPQNIQTFYPFASGTPPPKNPSSIPPPLLTSPSTPPLLENSSSSKKAVVKAVAATATSTFVAAALLFFWVQRFVIMRRRRRENDNDSGEGQSPVVNDEFARVDGNVKGLIVDENGLDVLYWRKLEGEYKKKWIREGVSNEGEEEQEEEEITQGRKVRRKPGPLQEIPLLRGKSSTSHKKVVPELDFQDRIGASAGVIQYAGPGYVMKAIETSKDVSQPSNLSATPLPPPTPVPPPITAKKSQSPPPQQQLSVSMPVPNRQDYGPPPPPPPPLVPANNLQTPPPPPPPVPPSITPKKSQAPPPPQQLSVSMPIPNRQGHGPPPPPPPPLVPANNLQTPPPPPPKAGKFPMPLKPSPGRQGPANDGEQGESSAGNGQVKLKPLHWDKVQKNSDQSMVWDKIQGGSFRFNDDLMEALFGYVATNRKSPRREKNTSPPENSNSASPKQIVLLDARKSQNIAIVLKSLDICRKELIDALNDGQGLDLDTLEKLNKVAPSKEEQSEIMKFHGDHSRLADAESFLYHLLKAIPSAFTRLDAMLFRANYETEILHFQEYLQVLELGSKELRNRGLFTKLLEAILKAGNRMNAGTSRGNAHAFKLTSLQKLSDVKSTDGKTTLLHFVVEEVVRYEGKRCVVHRNRSLSRNNSQSSNSGVVLERPESKEEREKEYMMLGLPVVGGLSSVFSNVKKAANIDYNSFVGTCSSIATRATEVRLLVSECATNGGAGFVREMKGFLEAAEQELKALKEEQKRVMEIVRKTSDYYQAGSSKDQGGNPLQLFVIIRDFLNMVDQVCVELARNLQKRKTPSSSSGSFPKSPATRVPVRFPNLPEHFMKEKYTGNFSESDSDP
ncbi:hypothetical protein K2173_021932 [Erythroxylum novogranatense]|uniref:Formin-like protein n=1 Tax=Erythroxylum novogranatense TaxID=1862640 RepID=A0AAV8T3E7_9ROSI|nr:hypothetical protein K2173_021932 [Erythroxylum novogranatense]